MSLITVDELYKINKNLNKNECEYYIDALNEVLPQYQIVTNIRLAHFLAQIIHESGNLRYKSENLNYTAATLRSVFSNHFQDDDINLYARKPERIANRVYGGRMGNGNELSGDGWKYRGRGLIQLTGRDNYKLCGEKLGLDLLKNPDLLCESPNVIVASACWYWNSRNLNGFADLDDILNITRKINGGINGLEDRKKNLAIAKDVLNC